MAASSLIAAPVRSCLTMLGIVIGVADPKGAAMYNLFAHGTAKATDGGSITEGIGLGRVTPIIEDLKVDKPYLIPDEEAVPVIFDSRETRREQKLGLRALLPVLHSSYMTISREL
jgi:hypothetical protein